MAHGIPSHARGHTARAPEMRQRCAVLLSACDALEMRRRCAGDAPEMRRRCAILLSASLLCLCSLPYLTPKRAFPCPGRRSLTPRYSSPSPLTAHPNPNLGWRSLTPYFSLGLTLRSYRPRSHAPCTIRALGPLTSSSVAFALLLTCQRRT